MEKDHHTLIVKGIDRDEYRYFKIRCAYLGLTISEVIRQFVKDFGTRESLPK